MLIFIRRFIESLRLASTQCKPSFHCPDLIRLRIEPPANIEAEEAVLGGIILDRYLKNGLFYPNLDKSTHHHLTLTASSGLQLGLSPSFLTLLTW